MEVMENGKFRPVRGTPTRDAGHRIWYSSGTNGFIFVRHLDIVQIENRGPVTSEQQKRLDETLKALKEAAEASRAQARRDLESLRERQKAAKVAEEEAEKSSKEEAATRARDEKAAKRTKLLERFPPTEWTPERKDKIRENMVVRGTAPSADENAWLEVYDEWKEAHDAWLKAEKERKVRAEAEAEAEKEAEGDTPAKEGSGEGEPAGKPAREPSGG
jgi:hypothetical protein